MAILLNRVNAVLRNGDIFVAANARQEQTALAVRQTWEATRRRVLAKIATTCTAAPTIVTTNRATNHAYRPTAIGGSRLRWLNVDIIAYVTCSSDVIVTWCSL